MDTYARALHAAARRHLQINHVRIYLLWCVWCAWWVGRLVHTLCVSRPPTHIKLLMLRTFVADWNLLSLQELALTSRSRFCLSQARRTPLELARNLHSISASRASLHRTGGCARRPACRCARTQTAGAESSLLGLSAFTHHEPLPLTSESSAASFVRALLI